MAKKTTKKVESNNGIVLSVEGFTNRFNIPDHWLSNSNNTEKFKNRCINAIAEFFGVITSTDRDDITSSVANYLGLKLSFPSFEFVLFLTGYGFDGSEMYKILKNDSFSDFTKEGILFDWLLILEIVLNTGNTSKEDKKKFAANVADALKISGMAAILCETPEGYRFYPANAELLDNKLVIDVLKWLDNYPKAKEQFDSALRLFLKGERTRRIPDDCRLSLELLVRNLLGNRKSLEKQTSDIGKYLADKGISNEFRNVFHQLLDCYTKYNNNNVKHDDAIDKNEIEFVIYMTGAFMRLLITASIEQICE